MAKKKIVLHEEDAPVTQLIGRKVKWIFKPEDVDGTCISVCTVELEPMQRAQPAHSHPQGEEAVYIVQGKGQVLIGDEITDIREGSVFLFPQGIPHMLRNTSNDTILKGVCVYGPCQAATGYAYHEDIDFPEFKSTCSI